MAVTNSGMILYTDNEGTVLKVGYDKIGTVFTF